MRTLRLNIAVISRCWELMGGYGTLIKRALPPTQVNLIANDRYPRLIGEEQWLNLNRNALTCLVSACRLEAKNIGPSSAKMQGQRRPKSHAIAITLRAQNK
jgi:hypothetical protein